MIRVYDRALAGPLGFSREEAVSFQLWERGAWSPSVLVSYPGGEDYQGLWWSPDGKAFLLAFRQGGEAWLELYLREQGVCRNLTACLDGFPAGDVGGTGGVSVPPVERGRTGSAAALRGGRRECGVPLV